MCLSGSPLILVGRNETSPLYALFTHNNGIIQDLTRSSIDLSDLLPLPTSYRDYMMKMINKAPFLLES